MAFVPTTSTPASAEQTPPSATSDASDASGSPGNPGDDGANSPTRREHGRVLPWFLLIAGLIGELASFVLMVEKIELLKDPNYVPTCSFNPVLSCGSVMDTPQAALFGFPNPMLGIVGFAMVAATGAALLAGARLAQWYWTLLWLGLTAGVVMVHWLIWQSLYTIGALCPYCMVVWAVTIPLWWYVTLRNVNYLATSPKSQQVARFLRKTSLVPPIVWAMVIIAMIADRFWYYWETLL